MKRILIALLLAISILAITPSFTAHAATARPATMSAWYADNGALNWAETQAGCWYNWGGTSCRTGYDCSGIVYEAFLHEGINIGRDTYDMLGNWHLRRTYYPRRGDLAFFGTGHVEFVTAWWHGTFGAQNWGTRVGWHTWSGWWAPTMFYEVIA